jgi:hypothetical protein
MKRQTLLILILLAVLLVSGVVLTQTALAGKETATGEIYHLTVLNWQVSGTSSAGEYNLQSYSPPPLTGNGCCCLYLPCILKP